MKDKDLEKKADAKAVDTYPGVAVNYGDDGKNDKALEKERTRTINNNPRNNKLDE